MSDSQSCDAGIQEDAKLLSQLDMLRVLVLHLPECPKKSLEDVKPHAECDFDTIRVPLYQFVDPLQTGECGCVMRTLVVMRFRYIKDGGAGSIRKRYYEVAFSCAAFRIGARRGVGVARVRVHDHDTVGVKCHLSRTRHSDVVIAKSRLRQ
jgi:hypothetical protein